MPSDASTPRTDSPSATDQARQAVKQHAETLWHDARETTRSKLGEQKHTVASGIGDVAVALRNSAGELDGRDQRTVARLARGAADSLEHLSTRLEERDLDALVRDAESLARRQPAVFFGAALAAGFLAVRFMKSSQSESR